MDFYYFPSSHWSRIVSLALAEKGLSPIRHFVDIRKNATFDPDYMRINAKGVVPTLVDDGKTVCNGMRILEYLDEVASPHMIPKEDGVAWLEELDAYPTMLLSYSVWVLGKHGERSAEILDDKISRAHRYAEEHPSLRQAYERKGHFFEGFKRDLLDPDHMAKTEAQCQDVLDRMGEVVAHRSWLSGPEYGRADMLATSVLFRMVDLGKLDAWSHDADHPLSRYFERLKARPSFAAVFRDDPLIP